MKNKEINVPTEVATEMVKNSIRVFAEDFKKDSIFKSFSFSKLAEIDKSLLNMQEDEARKACINNFKACYIDNVNFEQEKKDELITFLKMMINEKNN